MPIIACTAVAVSAWQPVKLPENTLKTFRMKPQTVHNPSFFRWTRTWSTIWARRSDKFVNDHVHCIWSTPTFMLWWLGLDKCIPPHENVLNRTENVYKLEDISDISNINYGERRSMIQPSAPTLAIFESISSPCSGLRNLMWIRKVVSLSRVQMRLSQ